MKIWKITPIDPDMAPWDYYYDMVHGFVVAAETEHDARDIAKKAQMDEGGYGVDPWSDPTLTRCIELIADGMQAGIVMRDFRAG